MPAPGAGFGFAVMGTDLFGDEPETAGFETKIGAEFNQPIFRFVLDGLTYDDFVIDAPIISRGADIIAGNASIVLSNTPKARIDGTGIAFVDGGASADTITDTGNGFIDAGFVAGDQITVSGSTNNNGDYLIAFLTAGTLTLSDGDSLTNEGAGDLVTILGLPAFNSFIRDRINTMGKPCRLSLHFSGTIGSLPLMTGIVEEVSYNGATVTLNVRDKMAAMLEKRIGSGQAPADFYSTVNPYNPATIVWNVLTTWGELDDTFTTSNKDMNFTGWQAWFARCAVHNYLCRGRFPGTTIQNMLLRIGDLTNSFIWVDGEGVFQFTMFEPPYVAGASDETYDVDNSISIDVDIDKSTIKNVMNIYYGHDPDANYNPKASITSTDISFHNWNPDQIIVERSPGFLDSGFDNNDPVTIRGSERNDGKYGIQSVTNTALVLYETNALTDEDEGASVTLTQNQDTSTMRSTTLVFNDTGSNDTITDVTESFTSAGIDAGDSVTISGSLSNDGTYAVDSVTANTITLDVAETLTQEASGALVILTQTHSVSLTATTISFFDDEVGPGPFRIFDPADVDHIDDSDFAFISSGFVPQYQVTVAGSNDNDGTYRLASVTAGKMELLHQSLNYEGSGQEVTITQAHTLSSSGKQFEAFVTDASAASIALYGNRVLTDEDKVVWHDTLLSAASAASAKLLIYKNPSEVVRIAATMVGFLSDLGDEIHVTEAHKQISDQTYFIKQVNLEVENCVAGIMAERGN